MTTSSAAQRPIPRAAYEFSVLVSLGDPIDLAGADGSRGVFTPILGGSVEGRLTGTVLEAGGDWSRFVGDTARLEARYLIDTEDVGLIQVVSTGYYEPAANYFQMTSVFDSDRAELAWLTRRLFVGVAEDLGDSILIHHYSFS